MAVFSMTSPTIQIGSAWTGTAPGDPGTQTVSGTINSGVNISIMVSQVDLSLQADELEYTNFASGGWRQKIGGLKMGTLQLTFNQDFAASQVDALFGLGGSSIPFGGTGTYYVDIRPTSAARGTTNPSYVLQVIPTSYTPLQGAAGDLATIQLQFPTTGQVARLTS